VLVSIIMPNFNGSSYIESSIVSVQNQTYQDWELIIVDDCSVDQSLNIIENYSKKDDRINFIKSNVNSGTPGVPRNIGLQHAAGKYIAFLDSDDLWHPDKIENQVRFMLKNKILFTFTNIFPFSIESEIQQHINTPLEINSNINFKKIQHSQMMKKNFIKSCSTSILDRKVLKDIEFSKNKDLKAVEDYLFWLDVLKNNCQYAYQIDSKYTYYRKSQSSISNSKFFMISQNIKLYKLLYNDTSFKNIKVFLNMMSYGFHSIKRIIFSTYKI